MHTGLPGSMPCVYLLAGVCSASCLIRVASMLYICRAGRTFLTCVKHLREVHSLRRSARADACTGAGDIS